MELKRYVMLEDKTITENRWGLWLRDADAMIIDGVGKPNNIGVMNKTSDNILDLVEVGDLVGTKRDGILEIIGEGLYTKITNKLYSIDIFTIYKLQPNGDYKKYKVK